MSLLCRRSKAFAFVSVCAAGITIAAGAFDASDNNSIVKAVTLSKRTNDGATKRNLVVSNGERARKRGKCYETLEAQHVAHTLLSFGEQTTAVAPTNDHCASDAEVGDDNSVEATSDGTETTEYKLNGRKYYGSKDNRKTYDGEYNRNRECHGEGTLVFRDGTEYKGHFENDKMKGQGTLKFKSGLVYHGKFDASGTFGELLELELLWWDQGRWDLHLALELLAVDEPGRLTFPRGNVTRIAQIDSNDGKKMMLSFVYSQRKYSTLPAKIYKGKIIYEGKIGVTYEGELNGVKPHGKGVLKALRKKTDGLRVIYDGEYQNGKMQGKGKLYKNEVEKLMKDKTRLTN